MHFYGSDISVLVRPIMQTGKILKKNYHNATFNSFVINCTEIHFAVKTTSNTKWNKCEQTSNTENNNYYGNKLL